MASPSPAAPPLLAFTDLDGTLLDHDGYDHAPAIPALNALAAIGAPVIPATSKTRAEVGMLMQTLGLPGPAIVENGAGVIGPLPGDAPAPCIDAIRTALARRPEAAPFLGFGAMGPAGVAAATGLAPEDAARAHARDFSEPGLWQGDAAGLEAFAAAMTEEGFALRRGGRFLHVLPAGADKAEAMARVRAAFPPCPAVALGDAPNDAGMLGAADIAIMIPNPHGPAPFGDAPPPAHARLAPHPGPAGWNAAMLALLRERGLLPAA